MSDRNHTNSEQALREGLREVPALPASEGFDDRVISALRPTPWWLSLRLQLTPALASGACAFALMLLLIRWSAVTPATSVSARSSSSRSDRFLEQALNQTNLRAGSLVALFPFHVPPNRQIPRAEPLGDSSVKPQQRRP